MEILILATPRKQTDMGSKNNTETAGDLSMYPEFPQYSAKEMSLFQNEVTVIKPFDWRILKMEITCYRDSEIRREKRTLSATTYNLAIQLLARCEAKQLFVPIRSMQYMAIVDTEEFVFVDSQRKCWIDIAWQNFHSHEREALNQPIEYEAVFYREELAATMQRLQIEFPLALSTMMTKQAPAKLAKVISFQRKSPSGNPEQ